VRLLREAPGGRAGEALHRGGAVAAIAVDTLGADLGAAEVAAGAASAVADGTRCILFGPRSELEEALRQSRSGQIEAIEIVDAPVEITNRDEPVRAVRSKPEASIVQAARAVGAGDADALVSAGATGAALAASLVHLKRLPGVYRPAVALVLPLPHSRVLFLDAGANTEVRPEHLVQFAHMGAAFSEVVVGVDRPRVALLSVGGEPEKGTADVVAAHEQLAGGDLDFRGNVEGHDMLEGKADVVVTDGFTGNVTLKAVEGALEVLGAAVREAASSGITPRLGGLLLAPRLRALRDRLDPEAVGGAYLLGLRRLVVVCHGRFSRAGVANAIKLADRGVSERVVERTSEALARASALRSAPGEGGDGADQPASVAADSVKSS
jgi:glycerol-3-phosphate acyltransferase PlsX